jgi:3-hydroxyacyl-CoA dehydrogenase
MSLETIDRVAVLGAGNMGHGITEVTAMAGYDVTMRDIKDEFVEDGYESIEWSLQKLEEKEMIDESADEILSRFSEESLEAGRPTSIEETLNIPIEDVRQAFQEKGVIHDAVDTALEAFVNIVVDLAKDAHQRMELRQERI